MKRYEGLLRPLTRPAPWPARWVIVDTVGQSIPVLERAGIRRTGLDSWHMLVLTMRGEHALCQEESCGSSSSRLWAMLGSLSERSGLTWCISPRALYSWTLLGFWERLLLGELTIAQDRPIRRRPKPDRGLGRAPGLLMAADPPSAALIELGAKTRRLTWVCASNYGWGGRYLDTAGLGACRQLAADVADSSAMLARYRLGGWGVTLGSMALRAWRSQHMKECLYVNRNERAERLTGSAIGGGGQLHRAGAGATNAAFCLDGRGLYSHLSRAADLPHGLRATGGADGAADDGGRSAIHGQLRRARLLSSDGRFPVRSGGRTNWPTGPIEAVLCGPELETAQRKGWIADLGEYATYNVGKPISGYCESCIAMRSDADKHGLICASVLAKGLAVALIGKLHAYDTEWEECQPDYNDPISGSWMGPDGRGGLTEWTATSGQVSRRIRSGLAWHAIPEIPLWIWSLGRVWLWERIDCAGREEVLYADTDGLICTERGYHRLGAAGYIRDGEYGQLRLVRGPVDVEILGPKQVRIGDELIQAGAPKAQRGTDFAAEGYWFRRPLDGARGAWQDGCFEEEYRARASATVDSALSPTGCDGLDR